MGYKSGLFVNLSGALIFRFFTGYPKHFYDFHKTDLHVCAVMDKPIKYECNIITE